MESYNTSISSHLRSAATSYLKKLPLPLYADASDIPMTHNNNDAGQYVMEDLGAVGGIAGIMKMLLAEGMIHGDCMTVTGKTIAENLEECPGLTPGACACVRVRAHRQTEMLEFMDLFRARHWIGCV